MGGILAGLLVQPLLQAESALPKPTENLSELHLKTSNDGNSTLSLSNLVQSFVFII